MWRSWRRISALMLIVSVVGHGLHNSDIDPTGTGEEVPMLLKGMGDGRKAHSLRVLANAVHRSQANLIMLERREEALENEHEALESSERSIAEMSRQVDRDIHGEDFILRNDSQTIWADPTMAGAGKSGFQKMLDVASEHLVSLALSGLTGVRASIPIFILAIRSKASDGRAIDLEEGYEWLYSTPALICLGVFLALELICDCIPVVSEAMDAAMLFVKPAVAAVIALAPEYGNEGVSGMVISACACCVLCIMIAVAKSAVTHSVDHQSNGGAAVPARSFLEDVAVAALSLMSTGFTIFAAIIVVCLGFLVISFSCFRGKKKGTTAKQ